ncbi:unnamed protein product [Parnassius mnemosyne]|uniref:Uncharacterized protein n=1 Tax=Parnassius mnemosyne TaxID=213953 RepID=A0AAV1LE51_9NEOP
MNFDDYARQITLKYRVALAIAIIKNKPDNISLDQYINRLRNQIDEIDMEYDSDMTICSDDFRFDDDNDNHENKDHFIDEQNINVNDVRDNILDVTQETNISNNILEGFELDKFVHENDGDSGNINPVSQVLNLFKEVELPNHKNVTFCHDDVQNDERESINPSTANYKQIDITEYNLDQNLTINDPNKDTYDSQQTQLYSFHGFTDNYTHVSQSQSEQMNIPKNHLFKVKLKSNISENGNETQEKQFENVAETELPHDANLRVNNDELFNLTNNCQSTVVTNKHTIINNNNVNYSDNLNVITDFNQSLKQKVTDTQDVVVMDDDEADNVDNSQTEIVSFKVIEELNRIKMFLNKKDKGSIDGYVTDSGYKSDSQSRSSFKGSMHIPDTWVNQSAHCLLNFVKSCPMVLRTREITNEISCVLGRLIDKLHEDEKYPSFLEDVLETVESLLREVHEENNYVEDVIFEKDDKINRLFLLNRSYHIIKFTIEKITTILENFYSQIKDDSLFEINNTAEIENFNYIFYILENLLKRHSVTKAMLSQTSTQTSQDDEKLLKRSSITDIWRKKWNPNYKPDVPQVSVDKKCVEVKCSEILNKIIVQAMDGYSLISYAALQCFNLLQS